MTKKAPVLIVLNFIIALLIIIYLLLNGRNSSIVFINSEQVFEQFNMAREMKKEGDKQLVTMQKKLDSLSLLINNPAYTNVKENLIGQYVFEKENLEKFAHDYPENESVKIWNRLKQYAKEFSKEKEYKMVLAVQPNSNILYGDEAIDVSAEFINYVNNKYEGNK